VFGIKHFTFFAGRDRTIELDERLSRPERKSCVPVIFNVEKKTAQFLTQNHESPFFQDPDSDVAISCVDQIHKPIAQLVGWKVTC